MKHIFFLALLSAPLAMNATTIKKITNNSLHDAFILTCDYAKGISAAPSKYAASSTDISKYAASFQIAPFFKTEGPTYVVPGTSHPRAGVSGGPLIINPECRSITVATMNGWNRYTIDSDKNELTIDKDGKVTIK